MDSENPEKCNLPAIYQDRLNSFQKAMLMKVLHNQKMISGLKEYVKEELGPFYIESPPFDLEGCLDDSTNVSPIIFVLSPGAAPMAYLLALAEAKGMKYMFKSTSLG